MNLHQFRFVREAVRQNFNLTSAAKALFTSQPGVSKAIIELEDELGVEIFRRHGKRIRSLTEPGKRILSSIERILDEVETLKRVVKILLAKIKATLLSPPPILKLAMRYLKCLLNLLSAFLKYASVFNKAVQDKLLSY